MKRKTDEVAAGIKEAGSVWAYAEKVADNWLPVEAAYSAYAVIAALYVPFFVMSMFYVPKELPLGDQGEKKNESLA